VTAPSFLPGLALAEAFYAEAVEPLLDAAFPGLPYAAALIGQGSEVLGLDDRTSSDHHWGPRLLLFLPDDVRAARREAIDRTLREKLPVRFRGWSTNFGEARPGEITRMLEPVERGPVKSRVELFSIRDFFKRHLAWDPASELDCADWLTFPQQALLEATSGRVFHDEIGLEDLRLRWYPHDVWPYLLASCWRRIAQEEHLAPRRRRSATTGSRLVAARLARDVVRLGFLLERRYAPYPKWLGTAARSSARSTCSGDSTDLAHPRWRRRLRELYR
jgi:hypothetical protein